ncbi:PREDICTED: E3 ubiquitin-protein ligase UBR3-like [Acropora digitifera]|uniref:E3 ubiquitin-protein ligase UBR3-like n=1 Tax=Acropora digitifera TaxID=70779 RepID=UPI00077A8360|nr:PREDICTED: E3 ubiquitin-protein ligase UBR3-like [Acropora digitifera]
MADGSSSVRAKQSTAANFKANCHTEKGKQEISGFLDGVLSLQRSFDVERQEWCLWLIAGGKRPEEFRNVLLSYDTPTICGLVWNKNFVAYRCRDCGISPCMSLCADCFHAGNHEGHDFNMFKSQAGGACDCGDEDVMKKEGFCDRHGVKESRGQSTPPGDLLAMAQIVIPRLCLRLHKQLRCMDPSLIDQVSDGMTDAEVLVNFLVQLSDTNTMKTIVAQSLMKRIVDIDTISSDRKPLSSSSVSSFSTPVLSPFERRGDTSFFSSGMSSDSFDDIVNFTFLDFLMDFVAQFEFPQKIVTFLLHLLPNADYKEAFTRVFCQNYQKIAKGLVYHRDSKGVEQLSNRIVHVSVQLFSNKILAEKVVQEQNLLHVMVKVLHEMTRPSLMKFRRGGTMHHQIYLGVNLNLRKVLRHVEFEPNTYYTAFSVELEAASAPLWSFINACKSMKNVQCVQNMISGTVEALERWYSRVSIKPQRGEVTFHLPLHRHLAAFMSLAVSHFEIPLEEVIPSQQLVRNICQELIHIQVNTIIRANAKEFKSRATVATWILIIAMRCHFLNFVHIPDKPGQTHNTHDFDKILSELADYRGPGFESGSMQQGIYVPKDFVWEEYFDYTHVLLRAVQRQDAETSMQRYKTRLCKNGAPQSGTLWPPFRPLKPLPEKFHGLMHILHSRKLHGVLFFIFHKAVEDRNSLPEPVLYLAVYLTKLALLENTRIPHFGSLANGDRQSRDSGCVIVDRCIDFLDAYGKDIEDLHEVGNHQPLNRDLLCKLELNPHSPLDPERISPQEVSAVMADVLHSHRLMKPPLFEPFLPFMNGVLSSTLQNQSSCQEKIAQLQHIQFLIEQQVPERRQLIIKLTNHLISVSQRPQTAARISGLVGDENKPHALELSMLLMYLHRYHEWLFRSYKVPLGWPKTIDDLGFTSVNMVDNVSYVAEAVQEPMDICDSSGTPELSNNGGPSCSDEHATHSHDDQGLNIWNSASFQGIVKQFKSVTKASQDVAMNLLKACKGNLEMAINLHYNREEIMPELANAVNDVAMETSPRDLASSDAPSETEGINQSILSLLVKLKTSMTSSCSSSPERSTACSDGLRYLSELLDTISYSSSENADTLRKLQPGPTQTSSSPSSPEGDSDDLAVKALRRKLARERQQKLLAEFASKQKTFMEKNMPKDAGIVLRMIAHVSNNLGHFNGKRIATTSPFPPQFQ